MNKLEELAEEIYHECQKDGEPVTKEQALEMAQMELGAKEIKNYVQSDKPKEKKPKAPKPLDEEKVVIIRYLEHLMSQMEWLENVEITNPQKFISFQIGSNNYSISLTKHKPPKK